MMQLRRDSTLPELERQLDGLAEGALFQISGRDYARLLGTNDGQVLDFGTLSPAMPCVVNHSPQVILFRKRFVRSDGPLIKHPIGDIEKHLTAA